MQELERKAYIFSVETIGLAMSMEKEGGQRELARKLKKASGQVYTLLTDALEAEENKDFADLLRASHQQAMNARDYLKQTGLSQAGLRNKQKELTGMVEEVIERMDNMLGKIIY